METNWDELEGEPLNVALAAAGFDLLGHRAGHSGEQPLVVDEKAALHQPPRLRQQRWWRSWARSSGR